MTPTIKRALACVAAAAIATLVIAAAPEKDHGHDHGHDHDRQPHGAPASKPGEAGAGDHADHAHAGHGHADEVKLTAEAVKRARIRVEPTTKRALTATFTAHARVAFNAEAMAHVGSLVAGRVVEIKARVGDAVNNGDALLVIESAELGQAQSDYLRLRTELDVALAAVEPLRESRDRAKKLYDQSQGVALAEVQKRDAEIKAAQGVALTAKAGVAAALNRLLLLGMGREDVKALEDSGVLSPRLVIRAPIAGRVIEREVTLGETVSPEKERLMVLADTDVVWVLADVPEARLAQIAVGSPARVRLAAVPEATLDGKVTHVAPTLNPDTRAGRVRIEVVNADGALKPGMFASVTLSAGSPNGEAVLAVPDEALQTVEGEPSVFVPVDGEPNTFARRAVKLGKPVGGMFPVLSGLKDGEPIVVSGSFILKAELGKGEAGHQH